MGWGSGPFSVGSWILLSFRRSAARNYHRATQSSTIADVSCSFPVLDCLGEDLPTKSRPSLYRIDRKPYGFSFLCRLVPLVRRFEPLSEVPPVLGSTSDPREHTRRISHLIVLDIPKIFTLIESYNHSMVCHHLLLRLLGLTPYQGTIVWIPVQLWLDESISCSI